MKEVIFTKTTEGKLDTLGFKQLMQFLRDYPNTDIKISLETKTPTRSEKIHNYYMAVVVRTVCKEINEQNTFGRLFDEEDTHAMLKGMFLGYKEVVTPQGVLKLPKSSKKLNNKSFCLYLEMIAAWASEYLNTEIKLPNEY